MAIDWEAFERLRQAIYSALEETDAAGLPEGHQLQAAGEAGVDRGWKDYVVTVSKDQVIVHRGQKL